MNITIFGDSIASGKQNGCDYSDIFVKSLEKRLKILTDNINFYQFTIPGIDSEQGKKMLKDIPLGCDYYICVFGVNDAAKHHSVTSTEYMENMIGFSEHFGIDKTFLVTPPAFNNSVGTIKRENNLATLYSQRLIASANRKNCRVVDFNYQLNLYSDFTYFLQKDGLHLNKEGYTLLAYLLTNKIISDNLI
ncbi:SGNH/GDSL hydrolase family protein [Lactococcus sp. KTH0-1S]|uniref:SGNH/GDSL hydrolase family protein n=1 Tax=Lactococcus sp. KTH0-1S TaxID=3438232 RepID=UPI00403C4338